MSDIGHEQTDKELKKLEKKITQEYQKATKEVEKKMNDYLSKFAKKDKEMAKKVKNGEITSQEYAEWRQNQMLTGKRWEQMRDTLAQDLVNADKIAAGMINDTLPDAYALNFNYGTYEVESGAEINTSFTLYDHDTVERLMREDPKIIPKARIDIPKDQLWNRQKITSAVTQGILQGESIDKIAKRLGKVTDMDRNAAIRNARTYTTAAENGGRIDSYERANKQGIQVNKMWMATLDDRTRYEHRHLDGVSIPNDEAFEIDGYKIDYPGDPDAEPEMIYNCRCTLVADIKGIDYNDERNDSKLGEMTYDEWKHALDKRVAPGGTEEDEATNTTTEEEKTNVEPNTKADEKQKEEPAAEERKQIPDTLKDYDEYAAEFREGIIEQIQDREVDPEVFTETNEMLNELIENNAFRIRIPAEDTTVVESIITDGRIKNQFETNTTGGLFDKRFRADASKGLFGYTEDLPNSGYEKYGYLGSKNVADDAGRKLKEYGGGIITLRKDSMMERTTLTMGDSLHMANIPANEEMGLGRTIATKVTEIDSTVCQFSAAYNGERRRDDLRETIDKYGIEKASQIGQFASGGYFELQYHGDVTLADIESITLSKEQWDEIANKPEIVEKLKENGVKAIYVEKKKAKEYEF